MPAADRPRKIPNRIFLGYDWQFYRPKYESLVPKLHARYPVHFLAVGRHSGQPAEDLFGSIKRAIESSSAAVFDASRGNANVSLEYGYAEGLGVRTYLMIDEVTLPARATQGTPIISDLAGARTNRYDNDRQLEEHLGAIAKNHEYTRRFVRFCNRKGIRGQRRRPYLRIIHHLGELIDREEILRRELLNHRS
jgi:hypothetical protein